MVPVLPGSSLMPLESAIKTIVEEVYGPVIRAEVDRILQDEIRRAELSLRRALTQLAAGSAINIQTWRDQFRAKGIEITVTLNLPEDKSDGTI